MENDLSSDAKDIISAIDIFAKHLRVESNRFLEESTSNTEFERELDKLAIGAVGMLTIALCALKGTVAEMDKLD